MDNRLNKIRKEMNILRAEMLRAEEQIRDEVNRDQDCTSSAQSLMAMRSAMTALVREWTHLGGLAHLPTVEERLKERRGPSTRARARYARPPTGARKVPADRANMTHKLSKPLKSQKRL
jgi:hypothetical protein